MEGLAIRIAAALAAAAVAYVPVASVGDAPAAPRAPERPNIVFILTDDLSWNLVRFMPHVREMQRDGMTFTNYFVTDSLCCPSRASIFTGEYPHNHRVFTNTGPNGGYAAFRRRPQSHTFATLLQASGYRTGVMGKYLNGYKPRYVVPRGWSDFEVPGGGAYSGFGYQLRANTRIAHFGRAPRAYFTDVLRRRGKRFVARAARDRQPFMLELASYAPHRPSTPAPRNRNDFPALAVPRGPAFDAATRNAPAWLRGRGPLSGENVAALDAEFRRRAQSVEAVDLLVAQVRGLLRRRGLSGSTYVVFSSDNGYHLGDRRLLAGKMTAYDSDVRVPLIVVGPGIKRRSVTRALAENVDLAPTFMRIAGRTPPASVDGRSLLPVLHGAPPAAWRDEVLIEHRHPEPAAGDPDRQAAPSGSPPSYEALRTDDWLYVEYVTGDREFYDLATDPNELDNRYADVAASTRDDLHARLVALERCRGRGCRVAATP